jgi:hypothetical protein
LVGTVVVGAVSMAALLQAFTPELPTVEGLVPALPTFADRIAVPTPTELEALVPAIPGGLVAVPEVPAG